LRLDHADEFYCHDGVPRLAGYLEGGEARYRIQT